MPEQDERRRILDMLEAGQITAEQATDLLRAVEAFGPPTDETPGGRPPRRFGARMIRISVDATKSDGSSAGTVRVNIPLALAKFASRFVPPDARAKLDDNDINLGALVAALGEDVPDGPLIDLDTTDDETGKAAKIRIEVV